MVHLVANLHRDLEQLNDIYSLTISTAEHEQLQDILLLRQQPR